MKKGFLIIVLLLSLLLVVGCAKKKGYTIKIIDLSDSLADLKISNKTDKVKNYFYVDEKEPKHQVLNTNFGEIEAEYLWTERIRDQFFYIKEFKDANRNLFAVNDSGIITSYSWRQSEKEMENIIDENQAIEIANEFIKKYNYLDFNDYITEIKFINNSREYVVSYTKYINELRTSDEAEIYVDEYGNLLSFVSTNLGMIPKDLELNYDFEMINEEITSILDNLLVNYRDKYDEITYEINNFDLILLDYDKYGLIYNVKIHCYEYISEDKTLYEQYDELIKFLVE